MVIPFKDSKPRLGANVFVAPGAWIIGDVSLADSSSVFFGSVLRGDILPISVGARSNIQEHSVLHTSDGRTPTIIGEEVTIGHRAIVHGCEVKDRSLIGMGATILDGVVIGEESIVAAGAVVLENTTIGPRSLAVGVPAKVVRTLSDKDVENLRDSADRYVQKAAEYLKLFTELP